MLAWAVEHRQAIAFLLRSGILSDLHVRVSCFGGGYEREK